MPKAATAAQAHVLTDIPNLGKSLSADLRSVDVHTPDDVRLMDPLAKYLALSGPMGHRHDPCVLDTFMAAHDFMNGGAAQPWWHFTAQRKALYGQIR
ncbi:helix-hairpin-helix domain-containing protein [Hydrogenophaga sp.]|uniref:helix-hairpin-helix domain-containing protein n=1 Tax=Hydrogenophaga sp. TaxID=1904254 RepID=UPI003566E4E8